MTTTDRELLERAAKAAGIELKGWTSISGHDEAVIGFDAYSVETWNPITDDGDALRLAVKLRLIISNNLKGDVVIVDWEGFADAIEQPIDTDPYAATRLAIVRAAAMIGGEDGVA